MNAEEIFEVQNLTFVEPSFGDLSGIDYLSDLLALPAQNGYGRLLIDMDDDPLAVAFSADESAWWASTCLYRPMTGEEIERFEQVGGDLYQTERHLWERAVRRSFAEEISAAVDPAFEDVPPDRAEKLESLIHEVWGREGSGPCIDCCCGSGIGSSIISKMGMEPLAYDNDEALIARGLIAGRLDPEGTLCIDGRTADVFLPPAERGLGIMLGEIHSFGTDLWEELVMVLFDLCEEALITVGTNRESELIREWGASADRKIEVFENERDPVYDRWVCVG
ncbi:MAG: hypothetical protein XE11_1552 [Methanomicrobiales archaeon 53_19]|jgi:hypothetical protein|uniref:hypothetical protein n=1 Tax=Methanocalculus sp. TaxID=2004547 RepID=UPI00074907FD|nr:hypothetical protein [Methanocalculus sp.]KUK69090.1 MAG: hypothetical protein XD88_1553 [Methanocalculus sp. 52_23]KUL02947.1 MAG: hypothetical protein XE11_1552 [Methanomicrobiales archaeon 53_19]HIJ07186.1 hypothetical protein [Methanocalculus sp.]